MLALYRGTHYRVMLADRTESTILVGAMAPTAIANWIDACGFAAYLTACNPWSQTLGERENDERLRDLRERLRSVRAVCLEGVASIPGQAWCERSLLVTGIGIDAIDAVARAFAQNAVLIVPADAVTRLRLYRADWHSADNATDLEWAPSTTIAMR